MLKIRLLQNLVRLSAAVWVIAFISLPISFAIGDPPSGQVLWAVLGTMFATAFSIGALRGAKCPACSNRFIGNTTEVHATWPLSEWPRPALFTRQCRYCRHG